MSSPQIKCTMLNKFTFSGIAILLLFSCQKSSQEEVSPGQEPAVRMATLTIEAQKSEATKALSQEGNSMIAYWRNTESVQVYKPSGARAGALNVLPGTGEKPASATLSGTLDITGLNEGDNLSLRIPRDEWDYSGQAGILTGTGSIEEKYDYATATVEIATIGENSITAASEAYFTNEQSIYRFGFIADAATLNVKLFVLGAAWQRLVRKIQDGVSDYGALKIVPDSPTTDLIYTSVRNEAVDPDSSGDTYYFTVVGSDGSAYLGSKAVPASVLDRHGRFISARTIPATKVILSRNTSESAVVF